MDLNQQKIQLTFRQENEVGAKKKGDGFVNLVKTGCVSYAGSYISNIPS